MIEIEQKDIAIEANSSEVYDHIMIDEDEVNFNKNVDQESLQNFLEEIYPNVKQFLEEDSSHLCKICY